MQFGKPCQVFIKGDFFMPHLRCGQELFYTFLGDFANYVISYHSLTYTFVLCHSLIMCVHAPTCTTELGCRVLQ